VRLDQSSTPATVDLFTFTSRCETKRSTPGIPISDAAATVSSRPVYEAVGVETDASVRPTWSAEIPAVPGCTVPWSTASRLPPTPAQRLASVIVSLSAVWLAIGPPETTERVIVNVPDATTKP